MSDPFAGAWLVREYVFDPGGEAIGVVDQQRRLESAGDGLVRVIQDCEPDARLDTHPMARFRGHHEFELTVDGNARRYTGPAVIGTGLDLGDGFMIGRGLWPWFGHNFSSFSVMVDPDRQLTGGTFLRASQPVAKIVGVAQPESVGEAPTLRGTRWPGSIDPLWRGVLRRVNPRGKLLRKHAIERQYYAHRWEQRGGQPETVELEPQGNTYRVTGSTEGEALMGNGKRFGWQLELEVVNESGHVIEINEVLDPERRVLVAIARHHIDHVLAYIDLVRLAASEKEPT